MRAPDKTHRIGWLLAATLALAAATPAAARPQEPVGDPYSRGMELIRAGDWLGALRLWDAARETLRGTGRSDPRIGIAYIETALAHRANPYYEAASETYIWGFSGENLHEHTKILREEVARILPLLLPSDEVAWRADLEAGVDAVAERLRAYWMERDPTPETVLNERLLEHWQRITYARQHLRQNESSVYGTDDRGLIYVKYGEPGMKRGGFLGATEMELRAWVVDPIARAQLRRLDSRPTYEVWVYDSLRPDGLTYFLFGSVGGTVRFALVDGVEDLINREAWSPNTRWYMPGGVRAFYYLQLFYYGDVSAIGGPYQTRAEELNALWGQAESWASSFGVGPPVPRESSLEAYDLRYRQENASDPAFHPVLATSRGAEPAEGSSQFSVRGEFGLQSLEGNFPFRQQHPYLMNAAGDRFLDGTGAEIDYGPGVQLDTLYTASNGDATSVTFQDRNYPPPRYNHIDRFFDPGEFVSLNAAVTGRTGNTSYRASFTNLRETGSVTFHDGYTRRNARLNIDQRIWDDLTVSLSGYYGWARQDEMSGDVLSTLTLMPPNVDLLERECLNPAGADPEDCLEYGDLIVMPDPLNPEMENPLYAQKKVTSEDRSSRALGSLFARWSPIPWLDVEADFGLGRFDFDQVSAVQDTDFSSKHNSKIQNVGASVTAAFHKQFGGLIALAKARYQFEDHADEWSSESTSGSSSVGESGSSDIRSDLIYLASAADYKGRYVIDASVRWEGSSWLPADRWSTYYRGSIAWRLAQEPWWFSDAIGEFKIRFSYGTAGRLPPFALEFLTQGDGALKRESSREAEWGLEMLAWNRLTFVIDYSDKKTEDLLHSVPLAGFQGFTQESRNAGTVAENTWELSLEAALARTPDLDWTARLTRERTRQVITELAVPPFREDAFFFRAGEQLGTYYGDRWATSCAELNPTAQAACDDQFQVNDDGYLVWVGAGNSPSDGISDRLWGTVGDVNGITYEFGMPIEALECERSQEDGNLKNVPAIECDRDTDGIIDAPPAGFVSQRLADFVRIGDTTPDYAWTLSTNLRWKRLTLYFLIDGEVGHDVYFQTGQWPMRELASSFVDQQDKPPGLMKPIKYYQFLYDVNEVNSFFARRGDYIRIREVALGYALDRDLVRSIFGFVGMESATIRLVGRNLLTFTDYPGYDPEFGEGTGGSDVVGRTDAHYYPNFRTITGTIEFTF